MIMDQGQNSSSANGCCDAPQTATKHIRTVRDCVDERIQNARQEVQAGCILKARLEALNVLDHPAEMYNYIHSY